MKKGYCSSRGTARRTCSVDTKVEQVVTQLQSQQKFGETVVFYDSAPFAAIRG